MRPPASLLRHQVKVWYGKHTAKTLSTNATSLLQLWGTGTDPVGSEGTADATFSGHVYPTTETLQAGRLGGVDVATWMLLCRHEVTLSIGDRVEALGERFVIQSIMEPIHGSRGSGVKEAVMLHISSQAPAAKTGVV